MYFGSREAAAEPTPRLRQKAGSFRIMSGKDRLRLGMVCRGVGGRIEICVESFTKPPQCETPFRGRTSGYFKHRNRLCKAEESALPKAGAIDRIAH
jgi:hypothetical protein